jgi:hypothetical protein
MKEGRAAFEAQAKPFVPQAKEARLYKGNDPTPYPLGSAGLSFPAASSSSASKRPLSSGAPKRCSRNSQRRYSSPGCSLFCALHSMQAETRLRYELHATAYNVNGRGLVVISSCGHAGIINSVRQIQKSTGIEKVHAVVGGWHLAPYPDELIAKTVAAMKEINPDYLIPMHRTGFRTTMAIQSEMPEKLIMPSTGTSVVFGA